jgi:hypothetical protein
VPQLHRVRGRAAGPVPRGDDEPAHALALGQVRLRGGVQGARRLLHQLHGPQLQEGELRGLHARLRALAPQAGADHGPVPGLVRVHAHPQRAHRAHQDRQGAAPLSLPHSPSRCHCYVARGRALRLVQGPFLRQTRSPIPTTNHGAIAVHKAVLTAPTEPRVAVRRFSPA